MQAPPQLPPTVIFVIWADAFTPEEPDLIERAGDVRPQAQAGLISDTRADTPDKIRVTCTAWPDED